MMSVPAAIKMVLAVFATAVAPVTSSAPPVQAARDPDFAADLNLLLQSLKKEAPGIYQKIDRRPRKALLEQVMTVLDSGVKALPENAPGPQSAAPEKTRVYPAKIIVSNTVFYARVDRLDETSLRVLTKHVLSAERLRRKPLGTILDLRSASGGDHAAVPGFLALFRPQKTRRAPAQEQEKDFLRTLLRNFLPVPRHVSAQKNAGIRPFPAAPLIVLCGAKTSGPAELLASLLARSGRHCVTMGGKTAGRVFPLKSFRCAGREWLVPQIDRPEWALISPSPYEPAVRFDPYPQFPFEKMGKIDLYENDEAIRRAVDLIRGLYAVRALVK